MDYVPLTKRRLSHKGFTLIEILVVVVLIAILAAIVIPQFGSSTEDAKVSALKSTLSTMRAAVELYYHQHSSRYPGVYKVDGLTLTASDAEAAAAFLPQLTMYTDVNGVTNTTRTTTYKYGPYIKSLTMPNNPFIDGATADDVLCDFDQNDITTVPSATGAGGWGYYSPIGRFYANDDTTLGDGSTNTETF